MQAKVSQLILPHQRINLASLNRYAQILGGRRDHELTVSAQSASGDLDFSHNRQLSYVHKLLHHFASILPPDIET